MFLLLGVFFVLLNVRLASLPRNFCEFSLKRASGVYKILSKISTKFRDNVIERNSTSFVCITFAHIVRLDSTTRIAMQMRWIAFRNVSK